MLTDEQFERIWAPYRGELQRDVVGLWMIVGRVREEFPGIDSERVRETVVEVIERAIRRGEAEAAFGPYGGDLEAWSEKPEEIAARVDEEWRALGREPNPGEIVWLQKVGGWPPRSPERVARGGAMIAQVRSRREAQWRQRDQP